MPIVDSIAGELSQGATTVSQQVNNLVSNTSLPSSLNAVAKTTDNIKNFAQSGLTNVGTGVIGTQAGQLLSGGLDSNAFSNQRSNLVELGNLYQGQFTGVEKKTVNVEPPFPNVLHNYASYNYIFTLSVLDEYSINFPNETYKKGILGPIILKSASGSPSDRISTEYTTSFNPEGKYDFFIDNLTMGGAIGFDKTTGNTNTLNIRFKVIEMYSMGVFFQAVQKAALDAGYKNYIDIPLLLTIEFIGHLNDVVQGIPAKRLSIENTTKHIPLKMLTLDMKVGQKGAEYDVTAYPWNYKAYSTSYFELKTDTMIVGKTVHEMLQTGSKSLQKVLNDKLKEVAKDENKRVPDQILIFFPSDLSSGSSVSGESDVDAGATINPSKSVPFYRQSLNEKLKISAGENGTLVQKESDMNMIGKSSMGFDSYRPGDPPFSKDNEVYNGLIYKRESIQLNPNESSFKFMQGSDILNAINQVILMSDYGRQALVKAQTSPTGKIIWWRVETYMFNMNKEENTEKTGTTPKLVVYRIVPYGIAASKFLAPNAADPKTEQAKKAAMREYNYIYTSKNLDILNFDIEFNAGFYQALAADGGKNNEGLVTSQQTGQTTNTTVEVNNSPTQGVKPSLESQEAPHDRRSDQIKTTSGDRGGGGHDNAESRAARVAHDVFVKGADMITLNLTILGDPYYIGDSGLGNYTAQATQYENINADYSIDYQTSEVDIIVNFRTPLDLNAQSGSYEFGPTKIVHQFSGLYRVNTVESNFNRGRFTQTLSLARRMGQTLDPAAKSAAAAGAPITLEANSKTKTAGDSSPFDNTEENAP